MAAPMTTGIPEALDLASGYVVRFAALDPTTGAAVANVTVSNASLYVTAVGGGGTETLNVGPFMLVPGPAA